MTQAINRQFRAHPVGFPLALIAIGAVLVLVGFYLEQAGSTTAGKAVPAISSGYRVRANLWILVMTIGLGSIALIIGLLTLPLGLFRDIRRSRHPVHLQCPGCGFASGRSDLHFQVERAPNVGYVMVKCPRCGYDFTVDKYAKLA